MVKFLRNKKCDFVICLTHMLNKSDRELVDNLEGVDAFFGGHEHGYFIYKNNKTIAIKSGSNFESFNEIIFEISKQPI